jgi:hypothetical protein
MSSLFYLGALLMYSQPVLASYVRNVVFKHPSASVHHSFITPDPSVRESERMQIWNLAAVLLGRCKGVETFDWQLAYGVQGEVWTVSHCSSRY